MVRGKIYERRVERTDLAAFEEQYRVISHKLVGGKPLLHIYADDAPPEGFSATDETLEDVYFAKLNSLI